MTHFVLNGEDTFKEIGGSQEAKSTERDRLEASPGFINLMVNKFLGKK